MLNNLESFLTVENIYFFANWGVLPFWLMLMVSPNEIISRIFVHSIIIPLLLATAYSYLGYLIFLEKNLFEVFNLYFGLEELYAVFSDEKFLFIFWLHFLALSLFVGAWIARDSSRNMVPRFLLIISLIITYFTGPVGLIIYWIFRIFFSKKITFNE